MRNARFAVIACACLGPTAANSDAPPGWPRVAFEAGPDRGIVRIVCRSGDSNEFVRTRAVIVDVDDATVPADILLSPSHGLPDDINDIRRNCLVAGGERNSTTIDSVYRPLLEPDAPGNDWAVAITTRKLSAGRLPVAALALPQLSSLIDARAPFRLLLYSSTADQHDCGFFAEGQPPYRELESSLFLHDCRTWAGLSGAPIVMSIEGRLVVVGINIGRRVRLQHDEGPPQAGVARAVDADVIDAIRDAVATIRAGSQREHRALLRRLSRN